MVLPDHMIEWLVKNHNVISPYDPANLQPSSYDVTLGSVFKGMLQSDSPLDLREQSQLDKAYFTLSRINGDHILIPRGEFLLGVTRETVAVPPDLVCRLEGRSSIGRVGLAIHITAGYIDPGFVGNITLEIANLSPRPIVLYPGMTIAQIGFLKMAAPARRSYMGRYQNDNTATGSRYGKH